MEIKGIKYTAPLLDNSGYAQASRGNILALHSLGIPLTLDPITFEETHPDLGENGKILKSLIKKDIDYNIHIIHTTPEFWGDKKEPGKTTIGYTIWETTLLHPQWKGYINDNVEMVMVGSEFNIDVFKNSGVTVPIHVVPHGIGADEFDGIEPFNIAGVKDDAYVFYSIFQWTERKHPLAAIKSYWHAFQKEENVALVLKTYRSSYKEEEKDAIRTTMRRLKAVTPMDWYPPVYLILDLLSNDEILGLHARGDCYVSLDRGEGFGLCPFTAGACGNPIMVTNFAGATEYAKRDNSYLIDYVLTPVFGMPWSPWYRGDQLWAEPSLEHAAMTMREIYNDQEGAARKGKLLQKSIYEDFEWKKIGQKIVDGIKRL
jgi:glycosyltransferase involved in cell wall biosynthesis